MNYARADTSWRRQDQPVTKRRKALRPLVKRDGGLRRSSVVSTRHARRHFRARRALAWCVSEPLEPLLLRALPHTARLS